MPLLHTVPDSPLAPWLRCPAPAVCAAAVLGDARHRVSLVGGREGQRRSLGSVYGAAVTRFLGGALRGVESRVIATPGARFCWSNVAVSRDGSTLLLSDIFGGSYYAIHEFAVADGSRRRIIGSRGDGPLQFTGSGPRQVWIASDGFVFLAEHCNNRVQVLTPHLDFHGFVGVGQLRGPFGVCANANVVVVTVTEGEPRSTALRCSTAVMALFFAGLGARAAVTVSWTSHWECAACLTTVTSQSRTSTVAA